MPSAPLQVGAVVWASFARCSEGLVATTSGVACAGAALLLAASMGRATAFARAETFGFFASRSQFIICSAQHECREEHFKTHKRKK